MRKFTPRIFLFLCLGIISANSFGQAVSLTPGGAAYTQNFDVMGTTLNIPAPWKVDVNTVPRTVGNYTTAVSTVMYLGGANMPSNNANGGTYNFGDGTTANGGTDRALGGLNTSNNPTTVNVYVDIENTSGLQTISNLQVSYDIEKYRNGKNNDGQAVDLYYATAPGGPWTIVPTFTRNYAADADNDGYATAPGSFQSVTGTVPVSLAPGSHLYLAWSISVPSTAVGGNASNSMALGIDNVRIIPGAAAAPAALHFRSNKTGNWNDVNTWDFSSDGITYTPAPAPHTPSFTDRTITVQNAHVVTVTASVMTDETLVAAGGSVVINSAVVLSVNDGTGFDLIVNGAMSGQDATARLVIKSVSTGTNEGTAAIGPSSGTITVPATVERLINSAANENAWRLLTAPLTGATNNFVFDNWQTATTVTGPTYIMAAGGTPGAPVSDANGLDYYTPSYSLKTFDGVDLQPVLNTRTAPLFTAGTNNSYFIFINGNRNASSPFTGGVQNQTTLTPTGFLRLGNVTFPNPTGTNFSLIGNPYAAPVDLNQFRLSNTTSGIESNYWYWDPYLTGTYGVGGYVTVSIDNGGNALITPQGGGAAGPNQTKFLQSSQAMFVKGTGAAPGTPVTFQEAQKSDNNVNHIFRTQSGELENIRINLNVVSGGSSTLIDGIVAAFDGSYSSSLDRFDAVKMFNTGENISFMRNGLAYSIERRGNIKSEDILYLNLTNLRANSFYQLDIKPALNANGLTAFLVDNYLKTSKQVDLTNGLTVDFTVNGDAASTGANRFHIAFAKPSVVSVGKEGISVYPNPVTNGVINLQMNNMAAGVYSVRVFNSLGQVVVNNQINHVSGNNTQVIRLGSAPKGIYQLDVVKPDNSKLSLKVVAN